uniref:Arrestin C-terminal-like domain-containing protein n=1 Tax=Panagrolaimus superbus TaxID=310955 RepID=A0A914YLV5_9BILA
MCVTSKTIAINSKDNSVGTYTLQVPAMTPSFSDCPIITISYNLFVNAVFSSGPAVNIPITIGTVPLQTNNSNPAADVLANANFTKITIEHKVGEIKDKEGPPTGYQAQVPFYANLTPS